MLERRNFIKNNLSKFVPTVISSLISEYDYYVNSKCELDLKGHSGLVYYCNLLPNERKNCLVSASTDGTIKIWNTLTGICELTIDAKLAGAWCNILPDGRIIILLEKYTINLYIHYNPTRRSIC